jgi:hypothetical protein
MTPNKQVSPAIRILRGERDASARATHLEAATEKYSVTTIERKQMSTTTNFKRIALVAVAALGLGVLSSVPSQATINADSVVLSSATAAQTTAETYTSTSAVATVNFFGAAGDSVTLTAALTAAPTGSTALPLLRLVETSSAVIDSAVALTAGVPATWNGTNANATSGRANKIDSSVVVANTATSISALSSSAQTIAKYAVYLYTPGTNTTSAAPVTAGTYTVKLTPAAVGVGPLVGATAQTLTITVTTSAAFSTTIAAANTTVYMQNTNTDAKLAAQDSTVIALKTSSTTYRANIVVNAKNAAGVALATLESVTATITGAGTLGIIQTGGIGTPTGTVTGRSISMNPNNDYLVVFSDGTSGVGTITLSGTTSGVALGTKKVTFTGTTPTKFAAATIAATDSTVIGTTGSNTTTVSVLPQDVDGSLVGGLVGGTTIWAYSSDTSIATVGAVSFTDADVGYSVTVTGVAVGTASISFGNAATASAATIKSAGASVRVGSATPSSVTVATDKATYAPGEKITVTVTILDSTGKAVLGRNTYANIFSSTGITTSLTMSGTATLPTTGTIADYSNLTNTKTYTTYAPVTGGTLTFSWTGGTALATASQVAGTKVVTVTDSGAAALAAVTALATTVASLKTLITTLTNLVLKIQKKVKA